MMRDHASILDQLLLSRFRVMIPSLCVNCLRPALKSKTLIYIGQQHLSLICRFKHTQTCIDHYSKNRELCELRKKVGFSIFVSFNVLKLVQNQLRTIVRNTF